MKMSQYWSCVAAASLCIIVANAITNPRPVEDFNGDEFNAYGSNTHDLVRKTFNGLIGGSSENDGIAAVASELVLQKLQNLDTPGWAWAGSTTRGSVLVAICQNNKFQYAFSQDKSDVFVGTNTSIVCNSEDRFATSDWKFKSLLYYAYE